MRVALELLRITLIIVLLGSLGWALMENIYMGDDISRSYSWIAVIGLLVLLFVLYRNKLQFTGWYKGKKQKLPRKLSIFLIVISSLLLVIPFIIASIL